MPYILYKSNGTKLATIADGSINSLISPLTFVGKNYAGYGEILNQNVLKLLENFANSTSPANPLVGQLWFDSSTKNLRVYDGVEFKALQNYSIATSAPANNNKAGDLFFNSSEQQLYLYNGQRFVLIGPQSVEFNGTALIPSTALDVNANSHYTLNFTVTDNTGTPKVIAVAARDEFTTNPADTLFAGNIPKVKQGITLPTADIHGVSISDRNEGAYLFWGTAATAMGMVDEVTWAYHPQSDYLLRADFDAQVSSTGRGLEIVNAGGLTVGVTRDFTFRYDVNQTWAGGQIVNNSGDSISFFASYRNDTTTATNVLTIVGPSLIPGKYVGEYLDVNIGAPLSPFANLYANTVTSKAFSVDDITNKRMVGGIVTANTLTALTQINGNVQGAWVTATNMTINTKFWGNDGEMLGTLKLLNLEITAGGKITGGLEGDIKGNVTGNVNGAALTGTNVTVINKLESKDIYATGVINGNIETTNIAVPGSTSNIPLPGQILGTWSLVGKSTLEATYADLAERYHADAHYGYGTVLVIGGLNEVTITTERASVAVAGIVSQNPAYKMNSEAGNNETHPYIALKGRVPCKVVGPVEKGELLVTSRKAGYAESAQMGDSPNAVIGKALENFEGFGDGIIEIKI